MFSARLGLIALARTAVARVPAVRGLAMVPGNPVHERLDKLIQANDVVVFMKGVPEAPMCGFSRAVVQILDAQGVEQYAHVNVLEDGEARMAAKEFSNWPTFPQVYVKGEFVGGTDIMMDMFRSGELEKLLVDKGVLAPEPADAAPKK
eukprot:Unigene11911_Nuclearia_a/m.36276 Unigene11911_Nuclearia_a/g.36276  ORF Unigene11911_Nuclearia_a/g.36276 Unigene11911_Nuclearia_a/m.36276 type:complete len:148 (-) Unigene11911_Nuclearia_a:62-505(-)